MVLKSRTQPLAMRLLRPSSAGSLLLLIVGVVKSPVRIPPVRVLNPTGIVQSHKQACEPCPTPAT